MSRTFTVLIVDDEKPAREKLRRFLAGESDVTRIYEARDAATAASVIAAERPDAVFLDIRMPGRSGLEILTTLPRDAMPVVVFATAHDEYARQAFDLEADDYLLKPFDRDRFQQALNRIRRGLAAERHAEDVERLWTVLRELGQGVTGSTVPRFMVEADGREHLLAAEEIEYVEADRNYVAIHAVGNVYRTRSTLSDVERRLPAGSFVRINRSQIVNLDRVVDLSAAGHGDRDVRLRSGAVLRLSRRYRERWDVWRG